MITTVNPIPVLSLDILPVSCAAPPRTPQKPRREFRGGCFSGRRAAGGGGVGTYVGEWGEEERKKKTHG